MSIAETLGQLALFADLTPSQLEAIAHSHEEGVFAPGERVLRRGLSGGNFYVILEGEASVEIDGESRAKLGRGEFFGEISALTGEPPTADVVAVTMLRCLVIPGPQLERLLLDRPQLMLRMLRMEARRLRTHARVAAVERPFPPGDYDVVVVGSGPGGLQTSYCLRQLGIRHALLSRDEQPGGMFQRFPDLPAADHLDEARRAGRAHHARVRVVRPQQPARRGAGAEGARARADGPRLRPALTRRDGGRSDRVRRARRLEARYGCTLGVDPLRGERLVLETSDGEYRCRAAVFALGVTEPWRAEVPGLEHAAALRRHPRAGALRRPRRVRRRQAQLRLRGRAGDPALGALDRARLAAPGTDRRARALGVTRALPAPATTSTPAAAPAPT